MKRGPVRLRSLGKSNGVAFTLIELMVVIAIITVISAIIFPVFSRAQETGRATACLSNMRQLGLAIQIYAQDWDDTYPMSRAPDAKHPPTGCLTPAGSNYVESGLWGSSVNWRRLILPYVKNRTVYECPSNGYHWKQSGYSAITGVGGDEANSYYAESDRLPASYALNGGFFHEAVPPCWYGESKVRPRLMSEVDRPAQLIMLVESRLSYPDLGSWAWAVGPDGNNWRGALQTHNGAINFLFADLHVKRMKLRQTCTKKLWTDAYPSKLDGCKDLGSLSSEYN